MPLLPTHTGPPGSGRRWIAGAFAGAVLLTAARGYHEPYAYPIGHWLLDFRHGFVKRGLVGTLVSPLYAWKSPAEIRNVVVTLSLLVLLAALAALAWGTFRLVLAATRPADRALLGAAALVTATSPIVVNMAYTAGFLDRFLELATLGAVVAASRRRRVAVAVLVLAGFAVHEMFLVYGLPMVLLATLLAAVPAGGAVDGRRLARDLGLVLGVAGLAWGGIALGQHLLSSEDIRAIERDIVRTGVLDVTGAKFATFHLRHGLTENLALQSGPFLGRILRGDLMRVVLPPLALLLGVGSLLLVRVRRARLIVPLVLATLAPLALHVVAWDTARFSAFTIFHAAVGLLAVVWVYGDRLAEGEPGPRARRAGWALTACAVPVLLGNVFMEIPGFPAQSVHDDAFLRWRTAPTTASFEECEPVFENSGFEEGNLDNWTVTGEAFAHAPSWATPPRSTLRHQGVVGHWWASSLYKGGKDPSSLRNRAQGSLESRPFRIDADHLMFTLGGGRDPDALYVALEVEGREVARETGANSDVLEPHVWDVRPYRARDAVIRVVDTRGGRWGHIYVDEFCFFRE